MFEDVDDQQRVEPALRRLGDVLVIEIEALIALRTAKTERLRRDFEAREGRVGAQLLELDKYFARAAAHFRDAARLLAGAFQDAVDPLRLGGRILGMPGRIVGEVLPLRRSEEHTSELQS